MLSLTTKSPYPNLLRAHNRGIVSLILCIELLDAIVALGLRVWGFEISAVKNSRRRRSAEGPASRTVPGRLSMRQPPGIRSGAGARATVSGGEGETSGSSKLCSFRPGSGMAAASWKQSNSNCPSPTPARPAFSHLCSRQQNHHPGGLPRTGVRWIDLRKPDSGEGEAAGSCWNGSSGRGGKFKG